MCLRKWCEVRSVPLESTLTDASLTASFTLCCCVPTPVTASRIVCGLVRLKTRHWDPAGHFSTTTGPILISSSNTLLRKRWVVRDAFMF